MLKFNMVHPRIEDIMLYMSPFTVCGDFSFLWSNDHYTALNERGNWHVFVSEHYALLKECM